MAFSGVKTNEDELSGRFPYFVRFPIQNFLFIAIHFCLHKLRTFCGHHVPMNYSRRHQSNNEKFQQFIDECLAFGIDIRLNGCIRKLDRRVPPVQKGAFCSGSSYRRLAFRVNDNGSRFAWAAQSIERIRPVGSAQVNSIGLLPSVFPDHNGHLAV